MTIPSKQELISLLETSSVKVKFKKSDGSERVMHCTRQAGYLPLQENKSTRAKPEYLITVWDLDKISWRSFKYDSVISVEVVS